MGLVLEGAGAVGVAALRAGLVRRIDGKQTVVMLTGRDVAPQLLLGGAPFLRFADGATLS